MTNSRLRVAVALLGIATLSSAACGAEEHVRTAPDPAPASAPAAAPSLTPAAAVAPVAPTTSVAPPDESGPADPAKGVDGLRPNQPIPVTTFGDNPPVGYVAWEDWNAPLEEYRAVPIRDVAGAQIGWWLTGAGWVDLKTVDDPKFDPKAYVDHVLTAMGPPPSVANG